MNKLGTITGWALIALGGLTLAVVFVGYWVAL
jgi:hypothetical protein